ncbi:MAG: GDP-mannose mannosyl hydrolase [Gammaproteobacteria bacterium]|nr:GDP-mannose mannosyl hydrolase [Gammaproteobacteria bacterium]
MSEKNNFAAIVKNAPLISIDLIVRNSDGHILVGYRNNEPARHSWFVPGGSIRKNETMDQAFSRISTNELNKEFLREHAIFKGVYEHFYNTNFTQSSDFGTHYVVLAHILNIGDYTPVSDDQHEEYRWMSEQEILTNTQVHEYTKNYFR